VELAAPSRHQPRRLIRAADPPSPRSSPDAYLTGDNQKAAANFSFTVRKIQELSCANLALAERLNTFMTPIAARLPPFVPPKGSA
jgi:hypothetical protein